MADDLEIFQSLVDQDGRYQREAYAFTLEAFNHTMEQRRRDGLVGHIDGADLCEGIRDFAERSFGYLTRTVFSQWGISQTRDFGEMVFAMVEAGLLSKQEGDTIDDFEDAYDFDEVFERSFIYE
ncbi:MAG: hypothetical protein KDB53_01540 [Planctomycetes bacterium]|nr:hypothetical protein [Planctomycetota bacterium]